MLSWVPAALSILAWKMGLQALAPTALQAAGIPKSTFFTMPALHPMPNTSKPWERRMRARTRDSWSRPTQVAMPIL